MSATIPVQSGQSLQPIGIVTRNRPAYLDVTLRSLSATALPDEVSLTVFDDASNDGAAVRHLYERYAGEITGVPRNWLTERAWMEAGLGIINERDRPLRGLAGAVDVVCLGGQPIGVARASCLALANLFAKHPDAPAVILLQDDVLFNADWYTRLTATAATIPSLGILSGMRLNRKMDMGDRPYIHSFSTAQCFYITRDAYRAAAGFFDPAGNHHARMRFDDTACKAVGRAGFAVTLINPFIGQHFGTVSLVRPRVGWHRNGAARRGRIGFYSRPPYVLADSVRVFRKAGALCV